MPTCSYCGEVFEREADYLDHLREHHADDLGPIDRRRVRRGERSSRISRNALLLLGLVIMVGAVVAFVMWEAGGSAGSPSGVGTVHYHGTIEMHVAGESVDFGDPRFVRPREHPAFHFDVPDDPQWHVHARGVSLRYALGTLDIELDENSLTFDGVTYVESDPGTTITVEVDGEPVGPGYVLRDGDHIKIEVAVDG